MKVVVTEYANDVPQDAGNQTIIVDNSDMLVKVDIAETTVVVREVPVNAGVGLLVVKVAEGLQGPQGPPGAGDHQVYSLAGVSSWTHTHPFLYLPEVRLIDASGLGVDIGVEYPDSSTVFIEFPMPFTGTVILS